MTLLHFSFRCVSILCMITQHTCCTCNKVYHRPPSQPRSKRYFCSIACKKAFYRDTRKEVVCRLCGKSISRPPSQAKGKQSFCSIVCKKAFHKAARREIVCKVCGRTISKPPSQAKGKSYCSNTCKYEDLRGPQRPWKERFWEKVTKNIDPDACWKWCGSVMDRRWNYGSFGFGGKTYRAHRLSWEIHYGKISPGTCVLHHCDNPNCVNPKHLFLGTHQDNVTDMYAKGRNIPYRKRTNVDRKGEKSGNFRLTDDIVGFIRAQPKTTTDGMLGEKFNVCRETISCARRRATWKHVK